MTKPDTQDQSQSLSRLSPDALMTGFTRSPIVASLLIAGVFHLVIIGGSAGLAYFNDKNEVAKNNQVDDQPKPDDTNTNAPKPGNGDDPARPADGDNEKPKTPEELERERIENTKQFQQTNELPKDGEIPVDPLMDMNIEDTTRDMENSK